MPFAFLNPWFWLGALALGAPIWLHLHRRKEKKIVRFSAVRFLEDQPAPARQPMRLRDWLLFCCRASALLLLVAAFAWPYVKRTDTHLLQESRVYILDNTLSRQARNGFQQDRDRIAGELGKASPEVQVAVVELTSIPRVIVSFGENASTAKGLVNALHPSFERGSYLAAFRLAAELLDQSLGLRKRIILLGDNQANQWTENVNSLPFLRRVQVDLPPRPAALLPNLSLSEPRVERLFVGDKSWISFTVRVNRVGEAAKARVRVRDNDRIVLEREVGFAQNTVLLQGQWEADPGQSLRGVAEVTGEPDSLAADNQVFFSLPPVQEGTVTLLAQSPYLRLALSPEIMRGHWATRELDWAGLAEENRAQSTSDVLLLESSYLQSTDARILFSRYLEDGRGVILLLDRVTPPVESFLRELDFEVAGNIQRDPPEHFEFVASSHRIFHPFSSPDYGNLLEVSLRNYFKVSGTRATPLVFAEGGNGVVFEAPRRRGKLFVAAFGLDREHTSWPIHSTFVPFLDLLLQAARSSELKPDNFEPGETMTLQLAGGNTEREVVLTAKGREVMKAPVEVGQAQVKLPSSPGLYELRFPGNDKTERVLSVNPSPKESELVYIESPPALASWRLDAAKGHEKAARGQVNLSAVLQQRYWWWMILAGLLALMAEMAFVARARRA